LLCSVEVSRKPLPLAPRSPGVPSPQYTQMRVPFATSWGICSVGSLRAHAGSLDGPHMSEDLKPPPSFIAMPISRGHQPCDRFTNPESEPA
jgi:hypothetical protein